MMRCGHCDRVYDSDFKEYCPICVEKTLTEGHSGRPGEPCDWCGAISEDREVLTDESFYVSSTYYVSST